MADVSNKTKLQLGSGFVKPPTSPSTPTKLLINHGKPNFTIQRSPKADDENRKTFAYTNGNNNNKENNSQNGEVVVKNTKFYGALNSVAAKETKSPAVETEEEKGYANVVLRRTPMVPPVARKEGEENVPEFILRQRAIQERLAKENVLDFENRRSGYFTQVQMSPTKPSPTSFVETMSSPAIVPGLEIPAPTYDKPADNKQQQQQQTNNVEKVEEKVEQVEQPKEQVEPEVESVQPVEHAKEEQHPVEEQKLEQVVQEKTEAPVEHKEEQKAEEKLENAVVEHKEEEEKVEHKEEEEKVEHKEEVLEKKSEVEESKVNGHVNDEEVANVIEEINKAIADEDVEAKEEEKPTFEVPVKHNYHPVDYQNQVQVVHAHEAVKTDENNNEGDQITISHTNGLQKPQVAEADPSGALGVNFEPKTVVSFSKDLGAGDNKYPDTVVVEKTPSPVDEDLKALSQVKFDIKENGEGIQITPVVKAEN